MTVIQNRRTLTLAMSLTLVAALSVVAIWLNHKRAVGRPLPIAVLALEHLETNESCPVDEENKEMNTLRRQAGLAEVKEDWRIVKCKMVVFDGPQITVLVDAKNQPVKVVLTSIHIPHQRSPEYPRTQEFDLVEGRYLGNAAEWRGEPPRLFMTKTYKKIKLDGPTTFFAADGSMICSCEFREGKPWSGRLLERDRFGVVRLDASFLNGKNHGQERRFSDGKLCGLRSFEQGVKHGLWQSYDGGQIHAEQIWKNGIEVSTKIFSANGQVSYEWYVDDSGLGARRSWNENGELDFYRGEFKGESHGRYYEKDHHETWYWYGKRLGQGDLGKVMFEQNVASTAASVPGVAF